MNELLTVREVQDLLKVERLTVYRMLKDGRLTGLKVGHQWRFPREHVQEFLYNSSSSSAARPVFDNTASQRAAEVLPLHCVQLIQDVFAELAEVTAITVTPDGQPLTEMSGSCRLLDLIRSTPRGEQACVSSWGRLLEAQGGTPGFVTCHAGLKYAGAPISLNGEVVAVLVAGHCYIEPPDPEEERARIEWLATDYRLDPSRMMDAARELTVLDERRRAQLCRWLSSVAHTFEQIGQERTRLVGKLRTIAAMSALER